MKYLFILLLFVGTLAGRWAWLEIPREWNPLACGFAVMISCIIALGLLTLLIEERF